MKRLTRTSRVIGFLEKVFRAINAKYFDNELSEPIITIQDSTAAKSKVSDWKEWYIDEGEGIYRYEMRFSSKVLACSIENLVCLLIHECVHLYHIQQGLQDCSRSGSYHNNRFRLKAEECSLSVDYDSSSGWSVITPTDDLIAWIIDQGWTDIAMRQLEDDADGKDDSDENTTEDEPEEQKPRKKKKSSTRKYVCPCCLQSVRATKDVHLICGDCMETMTLSS